MSDLIITYLTPPSLQGHMSWTTVFSVNSVVNVSVASSFVLQDVVPTLLSHPGLGLAKAEILLVTNQVNL